MSKPKVLIMGKFAWADPECHEILGPIAEIVYLESTSREEFFKDLAPGGKYSDVVAIFHEGSSGKAVGPTNAEMIEHFPPSVKWIAHKGAGYDGFDTDALVKKGIKLSNTPYAVDEATATTAVYLLIGAVRRFSFCEAHLRAGGFGLPKTIERDAHDLSNLTIGVLGMGSIGLSFVNYIRGFGMKMLYHNRSPSKLAPKDIEYVPDLYELLKQVDVLSIHVPLGPATMKLIGEKEIRTMKKGSIIINTARGKVIDEEAMIKALDDGHLASVGLDVFATEPLPDPRLVAMPQTTLLPHVGTENQDARRKMEVRAITNIRDFLNGGVGENLVAECK